MQVLINFVNTKNLPNTYLFLKKHFPSVLKTECFNEDNLNFEKEVRSTEIGHLFEHIFIDVLCFEKIKFGFNEAVFNGRTFWNWKRDAFGKFHIYVDIKNEDGIFLGGAFTKTIGLLEQILESNKFFSTDKNFLPVEID
ncbi:MAG: hypothetical protein HY344_01835 [Candidatus Levybacteria bacterium]|nr:hypothetical protein [Candidatus Levybacteria bacterium]